MSILLALLSGKGGSGKTTLALSMADLLCRCDVKTLLVDCDMSTNGAAYFYESLLTYQSRNKRIRVTSFHDLLYKGGLEQPVPLEIKAKLDFIPSISEISEQYLEEEAAAYGEDNIVCCLQKFANWVRCGYDTVLFDCQAGYSELLPALLPLADAVLFVMEADSISASAMRSLHLKIGNSFGRARLYQIFNKATKEEFDIYSKIVGTFFTNIGTLLFDWKIRQAFSRSQIPDLENSSAEYGADLCSICRILFFDIDVQMKLERFSDQLLYQKLKKERLQTKKKMDDLISEQRLHKKKQIIRPLSLFCIALMAELCLFLLLKDSMKSSLQLVSYDFVSLMVVAVCGTMLILVILLSVLDNPRGNQWEQRECEQKLKELDKELEKLEYLLRERADS